MIRVLTSQSAGQVMALDVPGSPSADLSKRGSSCTGFGYAGGQRSIAADIEHLREAEDRRAAAEPSTAPYHEAARDIEERAVRILSQVVEDEVAAEMARQEHEG